MRAAARSRPCLGAAAALALLAGSARAQRAPAIPASNPQVRAALAAIQRDNAWTLDQQASICEIPAPPFKEARRAAEFRRRLESHGLTNVRTDAEGNVIAERRGTGTGPTVMLSAHLDTVFPEGTDVKVSRTGTTLIGPGIGDDCRGLAVLLAAARAMNAARVQTTGTILFVGTVGEEGAGNLRGVRHLFTKELPGKVAYFISVDGTGLDVTSRAVGSARYRVTYKGPGGHSYGAFGMPNPIHALGRAIAKIGDIQVPASPRTTFSVGVISGGTSVNSISATGVMDVDLRSESQAELQAVDAKFRAALDTALREENARWPRSSVRLTVQVDEIGKRPAGAQPDSAPIVRTAIAAGRALGVTPSTGASSTDANVPLSLGIPSITIDGGGRGTGAHSLAESYDDTDRGYLGPQWAVLIAGALAGVR
jgi:acetylornithine deacetylase/succinyl-diaminopimelate desuccinylase-like protein